MDFGSKLSRAHPQDDVSWQKANSPFFQLMRCGSYRKVTAFMANIFFGIVASVHPHGAAVPVGIAGAAALSVEDKSGGSM